MHRTSVVHTRPTVLLRIEPFKIHASSRGLATAAGLAVAMGVHRSTVARVISGQHLPSPEFIAGALLAFPACSFADLFEIKK